MKLEDFVGKTGFNFKRDIECQTHNQKKVEESRDEYLKNKEFNKRRVFFDDGTYNPISKINLCKLPVYRSKNNFSTTFVSQ